jgi:capsular polysaccharide biosynthesis protein
MELKEYIRIIKKQKNVILNSVIALVILTTAFSLAKPVSYENDLILLVGRKGTQDTDNYKYDGYYAVQASDIFADNVSQWLGNASLVKEIYSRAGVKNESGSLRGFTKMFKAKKLSSQYVEVRYATADSQSAVKLAHAIVDVLGERAEALRTASNEEISFKIIYNDPLTIKTSNNLLLNNILALVGGLVIGIFLALGKEYFKSFPQI